MVKEEVKEEICNYVERSVHDWVTQQFYGTVLLELINANTDILYLVRNDLTPEDKPLVRKLIRKVIRKVLVEEIQKLSD